MGTESGKCRCCRRRSRTAVSRDGGDPSVPPRVAARKRSAGTRKRKIFAREVGDLAPAPHRAPENSYRIRATRTRATRSTRATRPTLATLPTLPTFAPLTTQRGNAKTQKQSCQPEVRRRKWKIEDGKSKIENRRWKIEDEETRRAAGPVGLGQRESEAVGGRK